MRRWGLAIAMLGLGLLSIPAFGADTPQPGMENANTPQPGTVNYVEGPAFIGGRPINNREVGNLQLDAGQELTTGAGKTEVLLTPGIFLRVDSNSAVKMITPDLAKTQVELEHGRAGVEVDQIFPQNCVQVLDAGVTTQLIKPGYYEFDASQPEVQVFKGRAEVLLRNEKWESVKDHHELALNSDAHLKTVDFNANPQNDELYNWSSLRSQYLAEANNQIAGEYAYGAGFYPGWYWDPVGLRLHIYRMGSVYEPVWMGILPVGRLGWMVRGRLLWPRVLWWPRISWRRRLPWRRLRGRRLPWRRIRRRGNARR